MYKLVLTLQYFFWGVIFPCVSIAVIGGLAIAGIYGLGGGVIRLVKREEQGGMSVLIGVVLLAVSLFLGWHFVRLVAQFFEHNANR